VRTVARSLLRCGERATGNARSWSAAAWPGPRPSNTWACTTPAVHADRITVSMSSLSTRDVQSTQQVLHTAGTEDHHYSYFQPSPKQNSNPPAAEQQCSDIIVRPLKSNLIFVTTHPLPNPSHITRPHTSPQPQSTPRHPSTFFDQSSSSLFRDHLYPTGAQDLASFTKRDNSTVVVRLRAAWSPALSFRTIHRLQHRYNSIFGGTVLAYPARGRKGPTGQIPISPLRDLTP
jgi:hypothetical protein